VVIQDNRFDGTDSVTVCPMTSTSISAPLMRVAIAPDQVNGLDSTNWIMVDKITTVRRAHVTARIGRLSATQLVDLERLVMVFLGLAD
jgi:mRNA interferase MazF